MESESEMSPSVEQLMIDVLKINIRKPIEMVCKNVDYAIKERLVLKIQIRNTLKT